MTDKNDILPVHRVRGVPGDRWVKCPHCAETVYLATGPFRGEQFQHKGVMTGAGCGGWLEIADNAKVENPE